MLRYSENKLNTEEAISSLFSTVKRELNARRILYDEVRRKVTDSDLVGDSDENIIIPMERYISVIATGYFGGKAPKYKVHAYDEDTNNVVSDLFERKGNDEKAIKEIEQIIAHITDYNDEEFHNLSMVWDFFTKRAAYEIYYKNKYGEYVYTKADALETVAIWDYSMPKNLIGIYRVIETTLADGTYQTMVELTTKNGKFYYLDTPEKRELFFNNNEAYKAKYGDEPLFKQDEELTQPAKWDDDIPATALEQEDGLAIHEPVISLIRAYERVVQNGRNMHKYNDDAILAVKGYKPENPMTIKNEDGKDVINPAREKEDEYVLTSRVRYLEEDGDLFWVKKDINDSAIENHKKTIMDLICLCSFVPNMTDLGFTQADNNSALEKKFFSLQQLISTFRGLFKAGYTRRWELILNKINKDKAKTYDFRDIETVLNVNLPTDTSSETSRVLSLRDLLADETLINMLPDDLDAKNEIAKKKQEAETNLEENQELMKKFSNNTENSNDKNLDNEAKEEIDSTPGEVIKGSKENEDKPDAIENLDKLKK